MNSTQAFFTGYLIGCLIQERVGSDIFGKIKVEPQWDEEASEYLPSFIVRFPSGQRLMVEVSEVKQ